LVTAPALRERKGIQRLSCHEPDSFPSSSRTFCQVSKDSRRSGGSRGSGRSAGSRGSSGSGRRVALQPFDPTAYEVSAPACTPPFSSYSQVSFHKLQKSTGYPFFFFESSLHVLCTSSASRTLTLKRACSKCCCGRPSHKGDVARRALERERAPSGRVPICTVLEPSVSLHVALSCFSCLYLSASVVSASRRGQQPLPYLDPDPRLQGPGVNHVRPLRQYHHAGLHVYPLFAKQPRTS
jgi:hypothetical protein